MTKFKIWTWGSCGRSYVEMIYPVKLDLRTITRNSGIVKTDWFTIDVINRDSRKNLNREFEFKDVYQPVIIYHHGALSCSQDFEKVYLVTKEADNVVVAKELPIKRETKTAHSGGYIVTREISYVEYKGSRIPLKEKEVSKSKAVYVVNVKVEGDKIVVGGDTYEIRETLKTLGFKWDPARRAWVAPASIGVENIKTELEGIPEVVVKT